MLRLLHFYLLDSDPETYPLTANSRIVNRPEDGENINDKTSKQS